MPSLKKLFFFPLSFYLLLFTSYFLFTSQIKAADEFSTSFNITYDVREDGTTKVIQNGSLTNKTSNYRASNYKLTLKNTGANNVSGYDSKGQLKLTVKKEGEGTVIEFPFNDIVAGKDKTLNWTIFYDSKSIATKNGQVWEIIIPGLPNQTEINNYNITLKVPESFGNATFFSPNSKVPGFWTKEEIGTKGIKVTYGETQLFSFALTYTLNNKNNHPVVTEIALPGDTAYQKIYLNKLYPEPEDVKIDGEGNWLAEYRLEKKQKLVVKALGEAEIFYKPQNYIFLTNEEKIEYTSPKKYWESTDPEIIKLAGELKTPEKIYQYVVNTLSYDYQKINEEKVSRLGAKEILKTPKSAICMEFTDLFIALCRAAKIPAREIDGYAFTSNAKLRPISLQNDILHAWPEYYDENKKNWIQVDPTWGNTTEGLDFFYNFDLNHFAFVTKGRNSEYPLPAGSYKDNEKEKNVYVDFAINKIDKNKNKNDLVKITVPEKVISGFPFYLKLEVNNAGGVLINEENININLYNLKIISSSDINIGKIPPYGKKEITYTLKSNNLFDSGIGQVSLFFNQQKIERQILIKPFFLDKIGLILGGFFAIIAVTGITIISRNLYLQKQKRRDPLRWQEQKHQGKS